MKPETIPLTKQTWRNVLALTWPFAPDHIRPLIPAELEPVLVEGYCRVTLAAFEVVRVELATPLALPTFPPFVQLEIRTTVTDGKDQGTWFLKADASSAAVATAARAAFGVDYGTADIAIDVTGEEERELRISARKTRPDPISVDLTARASAVTGPINGSDIDQSILGAAVAWSRGESGLKRIPIERDEARVSRAEVLALTETWLWSVGLRKPPGAPLGHYLRQAVISIHAPEIVTRGA